jgi:hypothetical protein
MVHVRHPETDRIAEVHESALPALNARGWEVVTSPAKKASVREWRDYALLVDEGNRKRINDATKAELIDRYSTEQPTDQAEPSADSSEENS